MAKGLTYAEAVQLLGGNLSVTAEQGFSTARTEMVRLGGLLTADLADAVRGLGRYERSRRLLAASVVVTVSSFCEAFDDCYAAVSTAISRARFRCRPRMPRTRVCWSTSRTGIAGSPNG